MRVVEPSSRPRTSTATNILDKWLSPPGIEYMCELEPLWLDADLAEKVQMGGIRIRIHENGLIWAGRLTT
jgi:hypothetical protein